MSGGFVFSRPDGSQRKVSGYRYQAPRASAKRYAAAQSHVANTPPKVDLRPLLTAVEDQGELSSCVANAVAGAYEYLVKRHRGDEAYDVSRLFVYYNGRAKSGSERDDGGMIIADAIDSLRTEGACSEKTWPYNPATVNKKPSREAYDEAAQFLVEDMQLVPLKLDAWKRALAEGYPIIFGISLYESFDKQKKKGLVPLPSPRESSRESHGGHAMLCVGYSDPDRVFIVRNSWGTTWGDRGYCYIPYEYLMNDKYNDGDSWIIRQLENVNLDEGTWGDDESLIGDFDSELAKMADDDYAAMIDAMGSVHLETRLALIFLHAAGADGEVSDEELRGIAQYLTGVLQRLGSDYDAERVLRQAKKHLGNERLHDESVELFGEHVPQTMLASILSSLREIVGTDDVSDEEEDYLAMLVEAWQVEEGESEDEEGEDEESDDEDDEDEDEDEEGDEDEDEESDDEDEESDEDEDEESDEDEDEESDEDEDEESDEDEDEESDEDEDEDDEDD
ncbi:MAG: C1 family peptidase [Minicystis sp.]